MKKVLAEIAILIIAYIISSVYGYYNSDAKGWSWLISAIFVLVAYVFMKLIMRRKK